MLFALNCIVAGVLGGLRLYGIKSVIFQAIAHVYVGGLFVYGYIDQPYAGAFRYSDDPGDIDFRSKPAFLRLAIALTVIEVVAFLGFKYGFLVQH